MYLKDTSDGATHAVIDAAEQQGLRTERLTYLPPPATCPELK